MDWQLWVGFAVASAVIGVVPGPGVLGIVGYAVSSGRTVALAAVAGMAIGNATAMTLSLAGVGALLAASALAFSIVKWAGALYLIGLGLITLLRSRGTAAGATQQPLRPRAAFFGSVAVGTFHPKTIVFFVAFAPQFIAADGDYVTQAAILIATFTGIVAITDATYAVAAARAARLLRSPSARLWSRRAGGGALIASGLATAAVHG
ncbi:LysE family translocator [Mangrovicella endophytica]|uniref:LysE family translocator n=1 Tax=Mangrovicella endophytica TaxID=2066697 RepID=UPI000C9E79D2|nr:LysE family translocator [Mangrovicella endophytica]